MSYYYPPDQPTQPLPVGSLRAPRSGTGRIVAIAATVALLVGGGVTTAVWLISDTKPTRSGVNYELGQRGPIAAPADDSTASEAPPASSAPGNVPGFQTSGDGPANVDDTGQALPPAVLDGARQAYRALAAGDLDAVQRLYLPDTAAGVVGWSTARARIAPGAVRARLVAALGNPPIYQPGAYLFADGDYGVGIAEDDGTIAFFGVGQGGGSSNGSTAGSGETPTLGAVWAPSQEGYGEVRPVAIFNGGDPTGLVQGVRWDSWGGSRAEADGMGYYVPDGSDVAHSVQRPVRVVAFDLGVCDGHPAYRSVAWYFPDQGETFGSAYRQEICD